MDSETIFIVIFAGVFGLLAVSPVVIALVGIIFGRINESRHFKSLDRREAERAGWLVTQLKSFPRLDPQGPTPTMVVSEVVIASDYLKTFLSSLKKFIGGELGSYERMQRRATREAVLRLLAAAEAKGFNALCNVRLESADIGGAAKMGKGASAMVSILASATAYRTLS